MKILSVLYFMQKFSSQEGITHPWFSTAPWNVMMNGPELNKSELVSVRPIYPPRIPDKTETLTSWLAYHAVFRRHFSQAGLLAFVSGLVLGLALAVSFVTNW